MPSPSPHFPMGPRYTLPSCTHSTGFVYSPPSKLLNCSGLHTSVLPGLQPPSASIEAPPSAWLERPLAIQSSQPCLSLRVRSLPLIVPLPLCPLYRLLLPAATPALLQDLLGRHEHHLLPPGHLLPCSCLASTRLCPSPEAGATAEVRPVPRGKGRVLLTFLSLPTQPTRQLQKAC